MKTNIKILLAIVLMFAAYSCSNDSNPADDGGKTDENSASNYYPGETGSKFVYNYSVLGKTSLDEIGSRTVTFTGTTSIDGSVYYTQKNVNKVALDSIVNFAHFRRTDAGVYFFVDTTGLSNFIPDSLSSALTMELDKEIIALVKNASQNPSWSAYKLNIKYGNIITFNIINVTATYQNTENITLNLGSGNVVKQAEKIKYDLKLSIPNLTTFLTQESLFTAYIWYVKGVGIVKLDGNATVLKAISGNSIDFDDTSKVMTQTLTSYELK